MVGTPPKTIKTSKKTRPKYLIIIFYIMCINLKWLYLLRVLEYKTDLIFDFSLLLTLYL